MRVEKRGTLNRYIIDPGEYFATNENAVISTILGSCVSACLFDPVNKVIGMNHFLLSNRTYSKSMHLCITEAGRYGVHAMELLINMMIEKGAERKFLKAKAFGGASIFQSAKKDNFMCVGSVNQRFITEFFEDEKIPLVSSHLGGLNGRVIHFFANDYSVYVRRIRKDRSMSVVLKEREFWKAAIEKQEKEIEDTDIWL